MISILVAPALRGSLFHRKRESQRRRELLKKFTRANGSVRVRLESWAD